MADKPDLSDLKARLGLTSPSNASVKPPNSGPPGPAPMSHPTGAPGPPPAAPPGPPVSNVPSAAPSARQPAPQSAPPQAAPQQAAPQQTAPQPQQRAQAPQQRSPQKKVAKAPVASIPVDIEPMPTKNSPKFIIGAIIAALVGAVFGYSAASVMNNRQLVEMRKTDAIAVQIKMKERVDAFKKAHEIIKGLNGKQVQYDLATKLNGIDFKAGAGVFASNRLLLGGEIITKITQFTTDSTALSSAIKKHDRATNKVDTAEIKKLIEKNDVLKQKLGVIYDYTKAAKNVEKEGFFNKPGQLAQLIKRSESDKNKVVVRVIGGTDEVEIDSRQFISIRGKDVLRVNGKNALSRYEFRVQNLKYHANVMAKYVDSIDVALGKITESGDTPSATTEK